MNIWGHLTTVLHHKREVRRGCFRVGLYWQGLTHDLSKFSPTEFITGCRYYQGTRSPNAAERDLYGYSKAWLHHKGRNRHHYEYWVDGSPVTRELVGIQMPDRFFVEMIMDRIAASKTYRGAAYTDADPLNYYLRGKDSLTIHPVTKSMLEQVLRMLAEQGETKTFLYLKEEVLHKDASSRMQHHYHDTEEQTHAGSSSTDQ